jgi:hypothetical protein
MQINSPITSKDFSINLPYEKDKDANLLASAYHTNVDNQRLAPLSMSYNSEYPIPVNSLPTISSRNTHHLRDSTKTKFLFQTGTTSKYKNYWAPKCICIVSVYPFFIEFSKILKTIYKFSRSSKVKKPIEKIIENLVIEVPVPPRGCYSVEYTLFNEKYILTQSQMNKLPFLSIEFEKIFINFKIEQILEIYKNVLLETRIIFFSQDLSNLTPIIQGFLSLIYPFKYPFQFVTILPEENFNFLESVSPYIIGINLKYHPNFFHDNDIDIESMTILIVDIDTRRLDILSPNLNKISILSQRKKFMLEEFPELPKHYKNKLASRITEYISKIKSHPSANEDRENFSFTIRNLFFQFIVNILQSYNKYLNTEYYTNNEISSPSIYNLFKIEEYIESQVAGDRPFYRKLIKETQIFVEFILKRMIPKDSKDKLEILLFDENLMEKSNRSIFSRRINTPFIHSNLYEVKNTYSVQKHRGFSEDEILNFRNPANRKEALKYGQEIFFEKGEILISYPIFPVLMTDIFFKNSARLYFMPPNLSEYLEPINIDIVSKSHLGGVRIQHSEMENYVYLCWIQMWAMTFWYHDEEEKRYRFQQLLKVLELVISHEMEIFNILFETLAKHGEDYMILKLYERLIFFKLNPSYSICTTVMKLIDKKQLLIKQGVGSIIKYVERYDFNKEYNTGKFRKRTFKNKNDVNILGDSVVFYTWDNCIECQTNINLEKLSRDFQKMRQDILWANCPNCGTGLIPKISVRFGKELNTYDKLKFDTSSWEGGVLFSPLHLKLNYNAGLLNEFGIKLDIESFKLRFNAIFWDSVWYFKIKDLVYDFMMPYESETNLEGLNTQIQSCFKIKRVPKINLACKKSEKIVNRKISNLEIDEKEHSQASIKLNDINENFENEIKLKDPVQQVDKNKNLENISNKKTLQESEIILQRMVLQEDDKIKISEKSSPQQNDIIINSDINTDTGETASPIKEILKSMPSIQSPIKNLDKFSSDTEINFNFYYKDPLKENKISDSKISPLQKQFTQEKAASIYLHSLSENNGLNKINPFKLTDSSTYTLSSQRAFEFEILSTKSKKLKRKNTYTKNYDDLLRSSSNDISGKIPPLAIPSHLVNLDPYGNLNSTQDYGYSIMVTEQSFINPNMLIDSSILHETSRILETDQSLLSELESYRGQKRMFYNNQLNVIKEDIDEGGNFLDKNNSPIKDQRNQDLTIIMDDERDIDTTPM